jgi:uncharacterized delta-60 repeat protein
VVLGACALKPPAPGAATAGSLDATFGSGGKVTTAILGDDEAFAVGRQTDGKIIVAGSASTGPASGDFALVRYTPDGALDRTFGSGAKVTTNFGGVSAARALALQPDGKIVAAGSARVFGPSNTGSGFALARYEPDGTVDTSFGTGGKVTTDFGGAVLGVALQPDGKIVAAGFASGFALIRYNGDGTLDATFGTGGKVTTPDFGHGFTAAQAVALQQDGKIVAAGTAGNGVGGIDFALVRYEHSGSLDPTFGTGGKVTTNFGGGSAADSVFALALQPDSKVVAAGVDSRNPSVAEQFALARYNANGTLDPTFGSGGRVLTSFGPFGTARAVAVQRDGKIVAAGRGGDVSPPTGIDFVVARYNRDGTPDPSFGIAGKVSTDYAGANDEAQAMAVQPDGNLLVAGTAVAGSSFHFAVARYLGASKALPPEPPGDDCDGKRGLSTPSANATTTRAGVRRVGRQECTDAGDARRGVSRSKAGTIRIAMRGSVAGSTPGV